MKSAKRSPSPIAERKLPSAELLAAACLLSLPVPQAAAQSFPAVAQPTQLILEVWVNGVRSPQWWEFDLLPDGGLATSAERLRRLGFVLDHAPGEVTADNARVPLSGIPGLNWRYDEARQTVEIDAADIALTPVVLDVGRTPRPIDFDAITRNYGAVLNYGVYADASDEGTHVSSQYDLRFLTRHGVASTAGYTAWKSGGPDAFGHVRLDTSWRTVNVRNVIAWTLGDTIGSGGQMGGAYRLGGIQIQRDFETRPDLVTTALPVLNGSAAVPSTLDLYVNGLRYFTGEVARGPFQFRSLPNVGGGATATLVLTDAAGRETRIDRPVFFVPGLLPRGKLDFSVEAGFPRLHYGSESFDYLGDIAASGSVRYGLTDDLTIMAHTEAMSDLVNGSLGAAIRFGQIGTLTAGLAASRYDDLTGASYLLQAQTRLNGVNLFGGIEHSDADYRNIVTATAPDHPGAWVEPTPVIAPGVRGAPVLSAFSRRTERLGANFSVGRTGFNLGYTRVKLADEDFGIANASVQHAFGNHLSLWGNAYQAFGDREDYGLVFGLSLRLGARSWASSNVARSAAATRIATRVTHNTGEGEGSWSVSLSDNEVVSGAGDPYRVADVRYRGGHTTLGAGVGQYGGGTHVDAYAEGAIALMDGVHFAPSIDRSFAVVRGAGPDTPVFVDTRQVTHTDANGRAFLPSLRSLARNTVAIDPRNLAVDMKAARTEIEVVPDDRAGVILDFGVEPEAAAILILVDEAGLFLPVGSVIMLEGGGDPVSVGYDGRAWLTGLAAHNRIVARRAGAAECSASFAFTPLPGGQVSIGPLTCR